MPASTAPAAKVRLHDDIRAMVGDLVDEADNRAGWAVSTYALVVHFARRPQPMPSAPADAWRIS